jgi:quinol monooxygenase YgiN
MYARITTFQCKPEKLNDAIALAEELKPEIMSIPGLKYWFDTGNEDGTCAVIAVYESHEAAQAASGTAKEIFSRFAEFMDAEPQPQGYQVLLHASNP